MNTADGASAALADRLDRLGLDETGQVTGPHTNGAGNANAAASKNSLSSKAAGAIIEDNDFDESVEELNRDLPPHACR